MVETLLGQTTVLQANESPIKSVKLFNSGGAEITRSFPLALLTRQDGPQIIQIVNLPASLHTVSASVTSTSGNVAILDYYNVSAAAPGGAPPTSQLLGELQAERLRLDDERRLRQQSFTFLTTYMDSLAQCKSPVTPEAAQIATFFDEFVEIGVTRSAVIAELDVKLVEIDRRIAEETDRLTKLSKKLPMKVVVALSCKNQVAVEGAELTVTYMVQHVSWKPVYDLRVTMDGNTPSSTVTLDFRCVVTQQTGEDWENVSMALTTANQGSQLIHLPEPKRIEISLGPTHPLFPTAFPQQPRNEQWPRSSLFGQASHNREEPSADNPAESPFASQAQAPAPAQPPAQPRTRAPPPPPPVPRAALAAFSSPPTVQPIIPPASPVLNQPVAELIAQGTKDPITHIASGFIFIPSDGSAHHALVASIPLHAEFMRVAVPSVDTRVYYTCEVKNTSEYVLLPGTVKTYLNSKHVSSTNIQSTDPPQILECSLAVDTGITTINNRSPDSLPAIAAFTGKVTTTYTSATFVNNTHAETICGVIVRTFIPLPADPRVTIILKEPAGLVDTDEGTVTLREGCVARWSTTGGRKGKQAGLFEWVCDVKPGTEVLKAVWDVCTPQGLKLVEQVRE